jgi:hypothetical protein
MYSEPRSLKAAATFKIMDFSNSSKVFPVYDPPRSGRSRRVIYYLATETLEHADN